MSNNNNIKKEGYKMDNPINCYGQFREKLHKKLFLFCEFEEHEIESIYEDVSKVGLEWEFIYSYCKLFFETDMSHLDCIIGAYQEWDL